MGGVCCVAAREKTLVNRTRSFPSSTHVVEATHRRQARYSPSWSFRWDSRTHVEGVADDLVQLPQIDSGCIESEIKTGGDTENEGLSDGGSLLDSLQTPSWQKSPVSAEIDGAHTDAKACGVCLKPLRNKSPWGAQKIMAGTNNELSVVAVLACGHVYHAECLEHATPEADRFDPPCLTCRVGEQPLSSKPKRAESEVKSRNKMSRIGAVDADSEVGDEVAVGSGRWKGKGPKMGASFSVRRPFLRRHFSVGSRSARPELEGGGESGGESRRKGFFWGWNRRV
ncbi:hypothetical protein QJS04_geneDACA005104 [Acorus gramineus]|uniref:RING-type domain-containing protein n=1 Tax=Acorus gramineus TaxID=55184 RepID=A0AAV9AUT9_ACOGR|nr:hypothetical protein QJS04_geneDACA005104 [Acorus gramineus]